MAVELVVIGSLVVYALVAVVMWVAWVRRIERESYYTPDTEDKVLWTLGGLLLGVVWPLSLPVYAILESDGGLVADLFFPEAASKRKRKQKKQAAARKADEYARLANQFRSYAADAEAKGDVALEESMNATYRMYGQLAEEAQKESIN